MIGDFVEIRKFKTAEEGIAIICSDITQRKMAEESMRASEERFQALCDGSRQSIIVHRDHKILYANKALADMYGYDGAHEIMSLESTNVLMPEDYREKSQRSHIKRLNGEIGSLGQVIRGRRKDSSIFWIDIRSFVLDWDGAPAICSIRHDITERKLAEQELVKSETRFRALAKNSIQGILVHRNLKPLYANSTVANMHGYKSPDKILALHNL